MTTPRLGAPELSTSQASKEATINETFYWLDAASMGGFAVIDRDLSTPPGSPSEGDCYILAAAPTGAWSTGAEDDIALFVNTSWEIRTPQDGWEAYVLDEAVKIAFTSGAWGIIGTFDGAAYLPLTGGTLSGDLVVPAETYGGGWNGSNEVPTKNDVYDKIESVVAAVPGAYTDEQAQDAVGTILTDTGLAVVTYSDATPSIDVNVPAAAGSDFRTGTDATKALTSDACWDAADYVTLNDSGGNIAVDLSTGLNFAMTMDGDYTLSAPSNGKPGQTGVIVFTQDGTGNQTLAYNAAWKFAGGTDPTLSTTASAVDLLFYQVLPNGTDVYANLVKAIA